MDIRMPQSEDEENDLIASSIMQIAASLMAKIVRRFRTKALARSTSKGEPNATTST